MNGIIVIDKPKDFTSFDVIAKLRGILGERRLGHGGTLDPMATGVLPVFAGKATKAVDILPNEQKRYTATVRFGIKTDTGDITGAITEQNEKMPTAQQLSQAIKSFLGKTQQIPPMYSALKVDGKRLYELARAGKTVERKARDIEIFSINLSSFDEDLHEFIIDVECSKGTYIRTLAEDVAAAVGCVASLSALRRTMSSGYNETQAYTLEQVIQARFDGALDTLFIPIETAFEKYDKVMLDENLARLFLNGFVFSTSRIPSGAEDEKIVSVYSEDGFLGTGISERGSFKKLKQFYFK